jgi:hypothetical protein
MQEIKIDWSEYVLFKGQDSEEYCKVAVKDAEFSPVLQDLVEETTVEPDKYRIVPLSMDFETLKNVLRYADMEKTRGIDLPIDKHADVEGGSSKKMQKTEDAKKDEGDAPMVTEDRNILQDWQIEFLDSLTGDNRGWLLKAADYIHYSRLMDVICTYVANLCQGKSTDEICEMFGVTDRLTDEQRAQIEAENEWMSLK